MGVPEAVVIMREENPPNVERFSAVGIDPGLGIDQASEELLLLALTQFKQPLLLDANALNMIASNKKLLYKIPPDDHYSSYCIV